MHRIWYQPTTQTQLRVIIHLILIRCLISFKLELLEVTNYICWECKMKCTIRIISWERRSLLKNASIMSDCWELRSTHWLQWLQMQALPHMTDHCWHVYRGNAEWMRQHKTISNPCNWYICFDNCPESRHWDNYIKLSYPHHIDILWISLQIKFLWHHTSIRVMQSIGKIKLWWFFTQVLYGEE